MEETQARFGERLGFVSAENQLAELAFLLRERFFLLRSAQSSADVEVGLTFVAAEVQDFEGAEVFAAFLELALDADEALACGVDRELAEVRAYPLPTKFLGDRSRCAGATEEVCHQIPFVAARPEDPVNQRFGFLSRVLEPLKGHRVGKINIRPDILHLFSL